MANPLGRSLRWRVLISMTALVVLAMSGLGILLSRSLERFYLMQVTSEARSLALVAAESAGPMLGRGDQEHLDSLLGAVDRAGPVRLLVVDAAGRVVGSSEEEERAWLGTVPPVAGLDEALAGQVVSHAEETFWESGEPLYYVVPLRHDGSIVGALRSSVQTADLDHEIARLNTLIIASIALTSAVAAILSISISESIARPLRRLRDGVAHLASGRLDHQIPVHGTDEVGQVAAAVNDLATQLDATERSRIDLMADVAHDIHTLAGSLSLASDALRSGASEDPALRRRLIDGIASHTRRLSRLASDLLTSANLEDGRGKVLPIDDRLDAVLDQVRDEFAADALLGRGIRFVVESEPVAVRVDRDRLVQALGNLIDNAARHTPAGGEIRLVGRRAEMGCEIVVSDTGRGIAPAELPHIFERFHRPAGSDGSPGRMGLGLNIVARLIAAHGGSIAVASQPGAGTTFTISLPSTAREQIPTSA
jgi:signal transduction histidine kinase